MGMGRALAVALVGLNGHVIEVEADIGQTLPNFILLGLPDASLSEARERIRSAAQNSGIPLSRRKITVNLVPASLPKKGSGFDLAIVMAALNAAGDVRRTGSTVFLAELGLDGRLRAVRGVLPAVLAALSAGYKEFVVAGANLAEAQLVSGAKVRGYDCLAQVVADFDANPQELIGLEGVTAAGIETAQPVSGVVANHEKVDLSEVAGQTVARLALEIAAAGGHHLMMIGPPGSGKTMLAERLPGLLPDLNDAQAMEVTAIHSLEHRASGLVGLIRRPPYERPHHSASTAAIIGGGSGIPRPGAATRAHRGVLFLDEAKNVQDSSSFRQVQPPVSVRLADARYRP
ncbi:ATP-binding protein [Arthrobacter sp. H35-MC1]|uniref:YifB family Mg chelatase-like AAA ATPase n=1 Tax=Arthrobacter sp. H35-MC1 TaxID=3046203 RepID=UPI0024B94FD0|nr:ATP-binding protein [Arthrobacter sp. H35-MC1]MDJ0316172.1 ATP-binding protein [Arthrobacter sp. H35-MC1]